MNKSVGSKVFSKPDYLYLAIIKRNKISLSLCSHFRFGRSISPEWWPQLLIYDIIMLVYVLKEILLKGITNKASPNITKLHYWIENFVKTRKKAVKCTAMVRGCVFIQYNQILCWNIICNWFLFLHLWNVPEMVSKHWKSNHTLQPLYWSLPPMLTKKLKSSPQFKQTYILYTLAR